MSFWGDKLRGVPPAQPTSIPSMLPAPQQAQQPAPQQPAPGAASGQITAGEAWQQWKGGRGVQNSGECPSCGSGNYVIRKTDGISRNGDPAPQCFDCGYPVVQFGSGTGTGGAQQAVSAGSAPIAGRAKEPGGFDVGFNPGTIIARVN